jgi:hypothetical protein
MLVPAVPDLMPMIMTVVMRMRGMFVRVVIVLVGHYVRRQSAPISTLTCSPTLRASAPSEYPPSSVETMQPFE